MQQIQMFNQTMARFKADPEWPTSELITTTLPETPPSGRLRAPWQVHQADVAQVMANLAGKLGVMNFASPTNPGGGVAYGAHAQEESIAKCTYLVPALRQFDESYYAKNRQDARGGLNSASLIYSAHVRQVFDDQGQPLSSHYLDIVTVAAPNLRRHPLLSQEAALADIQVKVLQTLRAFKAHGVELPILGAFGCGVFGNPAAPVGQIFAKTLMRQEFNGAFKQVVFAVFGESYQPFVAGLKKVAALPKDEGVQ